MIKQLLAVPILEPIVGTLLGGEIGYVPPPPPPPPQVPQGVVSFGSPTVTDTTISLPFTYNASDFTGFYVKLNNGVQVEAASPITASSLTPETSYNFKVAAYNATGTGTWYETNVTTDAAEPPPPPPPSVPVGTTTITATTPGETTVDITFTYTVGVNGVDYTGFEYQLNGGFWTSAPAAPGSFQLTGLTHSTWYTLYMRAVNGVGPGAVSAVANFTTLVPPPPPPETRWQYTFDGVDDRLMVPKSFIRNGFTGTYTWEFDLQSLTYGNLKCFASQTINSSGFSSIDLSIAMGNLNSRMTLRCMGQGANDSTFQNSVTWGPGIWKFTWNPTTKLFTVRKNGILAWSNTLTSATRTTINQTGPAAVMCAVGSVAGVYTAFTAGCMRNLKMWEDDVLVYELPIDNKDAATQVATVGPNATLFNQNTANWSEIPV